MRVLIISPGKSHAPEYRAAIGEYELRLSHALPVAWEFPRSGSLTEEGDAILKHIDAQDVVVLLDERGKEYTSEQFAALLSERELHGTKRLVFVIGGAYGVSDAIRARANTTLRLSAFVFPHQLVRLILVEQLYRAHSIRSGGKYHHA